MEKMYNLSKLFLEDEFDVQKGYSRYGNKEAYFSVLYKFTLDSKEILRRCSPEEYNNGNISIGALTRCVERLQEMLADIGAVNLAWSIESLNNSLKRRDYAEYVKRLGEILPDIDRLRTRIEATEKAPNEPNPVHGLPKANVDNKLPAGTKHRIKTRSGVFKKLVMLIDNFEFESAAETAKTIMRYSYTPEIDKTLDEVCGALDEFNFDKSLELAQKLFGLAMFAEKFESPVKKNILAIDDMPDVLRTVKAMLKDKYNVFGMTDYDSAMKFLRSNTADLILLDIEMPGIDGFAMVQLFRKLPEYANTPIVFLTSNVTDEHIRTALSLGARDFIKKPVNLGVLVNKLESIFSQG